MYINQDYTAQDILEKPHRSKIKKWFVSAGKNLLKVAIVAGVVILAAKAAEDDCENFTDLDNSEDEFDFENEFWADENWGFKNPEDMSDFELADFCRGGDFTED